MKTVLLTGANGFIGWYLVRDLLEKNYTIIATGKGPSRLPFNHENLIYEALDFTNSEEVYGVFKKFRPDAIIHNGAMGKPDECALQPESAFLTNVQGTKLLLQTAELFRSYFLFISTDFVFEGKSLAYREEDELNPVNYYGETKMLAEQAVKIYPFDWSIVRPIMVYGKPMSGRENLMTIVAAKLKKSESYQVFNDQTRMPTYVEDLSAAIVTVIIKRSKGIFHISGEDVMTPYRIALAVADHFGYDNNVLKEVTAADFKQPAMRPPVTGFDLTKARAELSYRPISFKEGLKKTFGI